MFPCQQRVVFPNCSFVSIYTEVRFMGELQSATLTREYPRLYVYSHAILYTWHELLTSMAFRYYMRTRDGVCNPYIPYRRHMSIILWSFGSDLFQEWKCHARYGSLTGHAKNYWLVPRLNCTWPDAIYMFPELGHRWFRQWLITPSHYLNPWWRHQMETFSALLAICAGNSPVPVNSPHKGQWRGALMFSLICIWITGWVNNREAGDLRRYRAHYDVTVMMNGELGHRWFRQWLITPSYYLNRIWLIIFNIL